MMIDVFLAPQWQIPANTALYDDSRIHCDKRLA
jgi:hypothetical protein